MGKCISDFSMPEKHLPPNPGKKMETTPTIEIMQPELSALSGIRSFSSGCCVPVIRYSSCRTETLASAKDNLALVSKTLDYEMRFGQHLCHSKLKDSSLNSDASSYILIIWFSTIYSVFL